MNLSEYRAFPGDTGDGMALRDFFAAQALAGILSDTGRMAGMSRQGLSDKEGVLYNVQWAYQHADAMLKERLNEL